MAEDMPIKADPVNRHICAETFIVHERHRFVWVWIGEKDKADLALIPDLWPCSSDGWRFDGGHSEIGSAYRLAVDHLTIGRASSGKERVRKCRFRWWPAH